MDEIIYSITCKEEHEIQVNISELEEILEWGNCPECTAEITSVTPNEIQVMCVGCTWEETTDYISVSSYLWNGCPRCTENGFKGDLHIVGSFYFEVAKYDEYVEPIKTEKLKRENRPDYWEVVIHFCQREELISILRERQIKAMPTGYYIHEGISAVCLSEVPLVYASEIRKIHGDYGIAFRKSQIIEYGGQPAIYLIDDLIKAQEIHGGFSSNLKPFINVLRIPQVAPSNKQQKRVDFLHEREWRVSKSINLNILQPLGLIFPEGHSTKKFAGKWADELLEYGFKYGEISSK